MSCWTGLKLGALTRAYLKDFMLKKGGRAERIDALYYNGLRQYRSKHNSVIVITSPVFNTILIAHMRIIRVELL